MIDDGQKIIFEPILPNMERIKAAHAMEKKHYYNKQGGVCFACKQHFEIDELSFELGTHCLLCRQCGHDKCFW